MNNGAQMAMKKIRMARAGVTNKNETSGGLLSIMEVGEDGHLATLTEPLLITSIIYDTKQITAILLSSRIYFQSLSAPLSCTERKFPQKTILMVRSYLSLLL